MSLFGHLAVRFGSQPENLATEALGYVLGKSESARRGFLSSFRGDVGSLPHDLAFTTQHASEDKGRPDLVGADHHGDLRALVEAKFWAGFTEHQPVDYLDQLPAGGVLVVICPEARLAHVWRELARRVREAKRDFEETSAPGDVGRAMVGDKRLVLQSWKRALNAIRLELSGEPEILADVAQLDGLCARMDSQAFLPMTSDELTSHVYRRVHEFGSMVDDVVATLNAEGTTNTKGLKSAAANGWYGRYLRLRGAFALLQVNTWKWHLLGPSPLWLVVRGSSWQPASAALAATQLPPYGQANPGVVHTEHTTGYPAIMLRVPAGAERVDVIMAVVEQLREIGEVIAPLGVGAKDVPPPPDEGAS